MHALLYVRCRVRGQRNLQGAVYAAPKERIVWRGPK